MRVLSPQQQSSLLRSCFGVDFIWWRMTGSNRRPPACKAGALPAELIPRKAPITALLNQWHSTAIQLSFAPRTACFLDDVGGSGWNRTNDPRLIKTVL